MAKLVDLLADALVGDARQQRRGHVARMRPCRRRHPADPGAEEPAGRDRNATDPGEHAGAVDVAVVAAKQLVAAISAQRDRHVTAGQLRDEQGRQLRRIGKRLVEDLGQTRNQRAARPRPLSSSSVWSVPRWLATASGVGGFIEGLFDETDRERLHRPGARRLHQRDDGRGVDAAREQRAQRHVGSEPALHRVDEQSIELVDGVDFGSGEQLFERHRGQLPAATSKPATAEETRSGLQR